MFLSSKHLYTCVVCLPVEHSSITSTHTGMYNMHLPMTVLLNANTGKKREDHTHSRSLFMLLFLLLHKMTTITIKSMNNAKVTIVPMALYMPTNRSWQCEVNFISEIDLRKGSDDMIIQFLNCPACISTLFHLRCNRLVLLASMPLD